MRVVALSVFPIKSLGGISLQRALVTRRGLAGDRRWMLVDRAGRFVSQREHPKLASFRTHATWRDGNLQTLTVTGPNGVRLDVPLIAEERPRCSVTVWGDVVQAQPVAGRVDVWFTERLGADVRLVTMPEDVVRPVDPEHASVGDETSFSDGFPLLAVSRTSLDDLNRRLETPVPMARFRANLVLDGEGAWDEDRWSRLETRSGLTFRAPKPCARCMVTTVDQTSGVVTGKEPLRTLATFRKRDGGAMFGQNFIPDLPRGDATIAVGDELHVTERTA